MRPELDPASLTPEERLREVAICGEAGELANLVKKKWRGDEFDLAEVRDEIADIRIYLEHISRHLNIDLDEACDRKLNEVVQRITAKERNAQSFTS